MEKPVNPYRQTPEDQRSRDPASTDEDDYGGGGSSTSQEGSSTGA